MIKYSNITLKQITIKTLKKKYSGESKDLP